VHTASASIFSSDKSPAEERETIQKERTELLKDIFSEQPELEKKIKNAPGYATFSIINVNLLLVATARGPGIIIDNKTNKQIYMDVISIGGGIGAGIKDLRLLIVFNEEKTMEQFIDSGWQFGASADASLKSGEKGAELGESIAVAAPGEDGSIDSSMSGGVSTITGEKPPMEIYTLTEAGISAQATISGVNFTKMIS
jgi:lipid-binding SYLF domain-containing protein